MEIKTLGRFEIIDEIGVGGMGLVYKGKDPRINRLVALKVVRPTLGTRSKEAQQKATDRFYVEAQAAGSLSHTNIVTIYDVGEEASPEGSMVYIAMEFLDGRGLDWHIDNRSFKSLKQKVDVVRQIAEGLDYAHKKNVIHRDVKPANIIVTHDTIPKITDFGLARLSDSSLTMSGTVLGTPSYMSPEQVAGKRADARSDLFSLSVVFYEILTGSKPFEGDSITAVIYKVVNEEPTPPSEIDPGIPPAVDSFIKRSLAKNPDQRFQTGAEYIKALDSLLTGGSKDIAFLGETTVEQPPRVSLFENDTVEMLAGVIPLPNVLKKAPRPALYGIGAGIVGILLLLLTLIFSGGKDDTKIVDTSGDASARSDTVNITTGTGTGTTTAGTVDTTPKDDEEGPITKVLTLGKATITSSPDNAEVFIGDKLIGSTPVNNFEVPLGEFTLKVKKKGYVTYEEKVTFTEEETFAITLEKGKVVPPPPPPPPKYKTPTLIVKVASDSMVVIDGRQYQGKTTITLEGLSEGTHQVFVQTPGRRPYSDRFSLEKGQVKTLDLR